VAFDNATSVDFFPSDNIPKVILNVRAS